MRNTDEVVPRAQAPRCRHVRVNGIRCGSPALRHQNFCYYHTQTYHSNPLRQIPPLEDANSIQFALTDLARRLLNGTIDLKLGKQLAYVYSLAIQNLRNCQLEPANAEDVTLDIAQEPQGAFDQPTPYSVEDLAIVAPLSGPPVDRLPTENKDELESLGISTAPRGGANAVRPDAVRVAQPPSAVRARHASASEAQPRPKQEPRRPLDHTNEPDRFPPTKAKPVDPSAAKLAASG